MPTFIEKAREYQEKNPGASALEVAEAIGTSKTYVSMMRGAGKIPRSQWKGRRPKSYVPASKPPSSFASNGGANIVAELRRQRDHHAAIVEKLDKALELLA